MPVAADCKVCPHCGKVVAAGAAPQYGGTPMRTPRPQNRNGAYGSAASRQQRQRQTQPPRGASTGGRSRSIYYCDDREYGGSEYGYGRERSAPRNEERRTAPSKSRSDQKKRGSRAFTGTAAKVFRGVTTALKIAVILAVLYGGIFVVQIYRVKLAGYPYDTKMKLSCNNYGQAISGYFKSGHWTVNPFTGRCTYSGETYHHEDMEMIFNARVKVTLAGMTVDGEPISESLTESKVMGMFI